MKNFRNLFFDHICNSHIVKFLAPQAENTSITLSVGEVFMNEIQFFANNRVQNKTEDIIVAKSTKK